MLSSVIFPLKKPIKHTDMNPGLKAKIAILNKLY